MAMELRHEETRSAARPEQRSRERRCIVTGEHGERGDLLRFVVAPDGSLVPDLAGRLPGRGLWVKPKRRLLERALKRKLFERAARRRLTVPADLPDRVGALLRQRCLDLLGLSRRAGLVVTGFDQVHALLEQGDAALLLEATDGAERPRRRLAALGVGRRTDLRIAEVFTAAELGAALGRRMAVHVAARDGGAAERLAAAIGRLTAYETDGPDVARK